jgi:hypothetical protein
MVESFGGICAICKKEYLPELFDFHHLNKKDKNFALTSCNRS